MAVLLGALMLACITAVGVYAHVASKLCSSVVQETAGTSACLQRTLRRAMLWAAGWSLLFCGVSAFIMRPTFFGLMLGGAVLVAMMTLFAFVVAFAAYPAFKKVTGVHWDRSAFVFRLVVKAWTLALPIGLTMMGLGAAGNVAEGGHGFDSQLGSLAILAAIVGLWVAQWPALRLLTLPGRIAEFPIARWSDECFRLAKRMDARLRDLLLLRTGRAPMAGAYYLGGGRIAITDSLLATLEQSEFLAVMAHELAHIAQRREIVNQVLVFGVASATSVALIALGVSALNLPAVFLVAATPILLIPFVRLLKLKRRHEDEADDAAVQHVGAKPLIYALAKTYAINGRLGDNLAGMVHRGLVCRLSRIASLSGLEPEEVSRAIEQVTPLQSRRAQVSFMRSR